MYPAVHQFLALFTHTFDTLYFFHLLSMYLFFQHPYRKSRQEAGSKLPYKTMDNNPKKKIRANSAAFFLGYICFCEYLSNKINGKNSTGLSKNFSF